MNNTFEVLVIRTVRVFDQESRPDDYDCYDDEQKLAWSLGQWEFMGIRAEADVVINAVVQTIQSGGLYGIESNAGEDYLNEVRSEEINALLDILVTMGAPLLQCIRHRQRFPYQNLGAVLLREVDFYQRATLDNEIQCAGGGHLDAAN